MILLSFVKNNSMPHSLILIFLLLLTACSNNEELNKIDLSEKSFHEGKKLLEEKCYVCHSPKITKEQLIAPPMIAIKEAYHFDSEEEFSSAFVSFIQNPSKNTALLPEAVDKYGLMPNQVYDVTSLQKIATYIFHNEIEKPIWWDNEKKSVDPVTKSFAEKGKEIAQTTQQALGKTLLQKINEEGVVEAIDFCYIEALPITDSMAKKHNVSIKRLTNKPRNQKNKAPEEIIAYIEEYQLHVQNGVELSPLTVNKADNIYFYAPIITQQMCLKCHGNPGEEIAVSTFDFLQKKYPSDKALGYSENQVRGVWEIIFKNE